MSCSDKDRIIKVIKESFENSVYPGDDNLFGEVYDPDIPDFIKILRGKNWKKTLNRLEKLEGTSLNFYQSMFVFMTPEALLYFTPAFLIIAMAPNSEMFGVSFEDQLMPDRSEWSKQRFSQLVSLFSNRQKHAIALAVDCMHSEYREEYIVMRDNQLLQYLEYWSQWLNS